MVEFNWHSTFSLIGPDHVSGHGLNPIDPQIDLSIIKFFLPFYLTMHIIYFKPVHIYLSIYLCVCVCVCMCVCMYV